MKQPEERKIVERNKRTLGVFSVRTSFSVGMSLKRFITWVMQVILIVYFNVCGGPLGSETIFSACGPLVGLVSLFVFPTVSQKCILLQLPFAVCLHWRTVCVCSG